MTTLHAGYLPILDITGIERGAAHSFLTEQDWQRIVDEVERSANYLAGIQGRRAAASELEDRLCEAFRDDADLMGVVKSLA